MIRALKMGNFIRLKDGDVFDLKGFIDKEKKRYKLSGLEFNNNNTDPDASYFAATFNYYAKPKGDAKSLTVAPPEDPEKGYFFGIGFYTPMVRHSDNLRELVDLWILDCPNDRSKNRIFESLGEALHMAIDSYKPQMIECTVYGSNFTSSGLENFVKYNVDKKQLEILEKGVD